MSRGARLCFAADAGDAVQRSTAFARLASSHRTIDRSATNGTIARDADLRRLLDDVVELVALREGLEERDLRARARRRTSPCDISPHDVVTDVGHDGVEDAAGVVGDGDRLAGTHAQHARRVVRLVAA